MHCIKLATGSLFLFLLVVLNDPAYSAAACKGPNKYDAGCPEAGAAAAVPVAVDNATVDWFNQKIILRGSGLSGAAEFKLGGSSALAFNTLDDTVVELAFDNTLAGEVDQQGNYVLKVDGSSVLSLFFVSEIVSPAVTECPCETPWSAELASLWGPKNTQCLEIPGTGANTYVDIAGTILSDPTDAAVYPQYPIGAAFVPGNPVSSVCRLVKIETNLAETEIVNLRINEGQQATCAAALKSNVCADPPP